MKKLTSSKQLCLWRFVIAVVVLGTIAPSCAAQRYPPQSFNLPATGNSFVRFSLPPANSKSAHRRGGISGLEVGPMTDDGQSFWAVSDTGEIFQFVPELQDGRIASLAIVFSGILKKPDGSPLKVGDDEHANSDRDPESLAIVDDTLYVSTESVPTVYSFKVNGGKLNTRAEPCPWEPPVAVENLLRGKNGDDSNDGLEAITRYPSESSCGLLGWAQVKPSDFEVNKWPAWLFEHSPKDQFNAKQLSTSLSSDSEKQTHIVAASTFKDEVFVLIRETASNNSVTQNFQVAKFESDRAGHYSFKSVYKTKEPLPIREDTHQFGVVEGLAVFEYQNRLHALIATDTINKRPLDPDESLVTALMLIDLCKL